MLVSLARLCRAQPSAALLHQTSGGRLALTPLTRPQVNVGSMSDPDDFPGLAHFCEHMLFYASEKYPEVWGARSGQIKADGRDSAAAGRGWTQYSW
eukprot:366570-Chlamydomonas_euryale.AAC.5